MRTIYEIICAIIFVFLNVTLVSIVYIYNRHPIKQYNGKKLTPDELSQLIAREIGNLPVYFTYKKNSDNNYTVYELSRTDNLTYEEREFECPVNFDGTKAKPLNESNFKLEHIVKETDDSSGFKVPGVDKAFMCPEYYEWKPNLMKCVEKPLCDNYNNSIRTLKDRYYNEIDNPSITAVTQLTGNRFHPRLYIRCSSLHQKPIIEACSQENEMVDEAAFDTTHDYLNKRPCKVFDVCKDYKNGTRHAYRISNNFSEALKVNQYYECVSGKSEERTCQNNFECNEQYVEDNDICKPKDFCRPNIDYYFTINPNSYYYCLSNNRQEIPCDEDGIIKLSDNSYRCKTDKYVYYANESQQDDGVLNGFMYKYKIDKGLQSTSLKWPLFDTWYEEIFKKKYTPISFEKIPITHDTIFEFDKGGKRKYYENVNDMTLPTAFYFEYMKIEKWTLFEKADNVVNLMRRFIDPSKVIHLSTSNAMPEIGATIKNGSGYFDSAKSHIDPDQYYKIKIIPEDYGLKNNKDLKDLWVIYNNHIYKYSKASEKTEMWTNESESYYSFIGALTNEPKKLESDRIIAKAFRKLDGIHYALCLKHDNKFTYDSRKIRHTSLENLVDESNIQVTDLEMKLNLQNLIDNEGILPKNFPINDFIWDNLYVGKYYYDEPRTQLIIWHDHLFVLALEKIVTDAIKQFSIVDGQFKHRNYPTNIVKYTYENVSAEYKNKKYETALATTFNYYNQNYEDPVVHWLSYLPVEPATFDPPKLSTPSESSDSSASLATEDKSSEEYSILNYFTIKYPKLKQSTISETLLNILQLKPFTLTFD